MRHHYFTTLLIFFLYWPRLSVSFAQTWSLNDASERARTASVQALEAKQAFISTYWAWRSYEASRLPAFYLYGNLMNYDRSLVMLQDPANGAIKYVGTHNLQNGIGLMVSQNIPWTGGTVTLYSDLKRIDQFSSATPLTWFTQPLTFSYNQPLFSYNAFKWDKRIAPKAYEKGKRTYLEAMEQVNLDVVDAYYLLLESQEKTKAARNNLEYSRKVLHVANDRLRLGTLTRNEYLQLELRLLKDSLSVHAFSQAEKEARMALKSLLALDDSLPVEVVFNDQFPSFLLDYGQVIDKALNNASLFLDHEVRQLTALSSVDKAKADQGLIVSFYARFGLSKTATSFSESYMKPLDQEVLGLHFSIPIFDWGLGKGKVQKALAAKEVILAQVEQEIGDYKKTIFSLVSQFNLQSDQCQVSKRAMEIASERYAIVIDNFRSGEVSVLEVNTARTDADDTRTQYVKDVWTYWSLFYRIRKETLFDFQKNEDIRLNEKELTE